MQCEHRQERGQTYLSVLAIYPVIRDDDGTAAVAANYDLLAVPGGSAARQLAETGVARQLVESHLAHAKVGLGDEVIHGLVADNHRLLLQLTPA